MVVEAAESYSDAGYTAIDSFEGNLTKDVTSSLPLNTMVADNTVQCRIQRL